MWKQSFRDVPDAFLLRGCIIVNTSYLGCWGPLFEWWQLGDVNPVRWNSYTDLHLNLAKKRFKINVFTCAICGLRCELSSQVHSDWTRLLHMLIDVWFSTAQENPSLFSFHCFRLITFLPRSYIPQYWKFNRWPAPTTTPISNSSHPLHATESHRPAKLGRHLP